MTERNAALCGLWEQIAEFCFLNQDTEKPSRSIKSRGEFFLNELKIGFKESDSFKERLVKLNAWISSPDDPNNAEKITLLPEKNEVKVFLELKGRADKDRKLKAIGIIRRLGCEPSENWAENKRFLKTVLKDWEKYGTTQAQEAAADPVNWFYDALGVVGIKPEEWEAVDHQQAITIYRDVVPGGENLISSFCNAQNRVLHKALAEWLITSGKAKELRQQVADMLAKDPTVLKPGEVEKLVLDCEIDTRKIDTDDEIRARLVQWMGPPPWEDIEEPKKETAAAPLDTESLDDDDDNFEETDLSEEEADLADYQERSRSRIQDDEDDEEDEPQRSRKSIVEDIVLADEEVERLEAKLGVINKKRSDIRDKIKVKENEIRSLRKELRSLPLFRSMLDEL